MSEGNSKSILITGATSGIGQQLAKDYYLRGWQVWACGRSQKKLDDLSSQLIDLEDKDSDDKDSDDKDADDKDADDKDPDDKDVDSNDRVGSLKTLQFDVTDLAETKQVLATLKTLPKVIVLNAGNAEYIEEGQLDAELFRRIFDVNFFGVVNCIEALQDNFVRGTKLVVVSSSSAYLPLPRAEAYGASKAAVSYLTKTLAIDYAGKVDVLLVCPGFVKTPLTDKNDFPMPTAISVERASAEIREGIDKSKLEISFPKRLTIPMKIVAVLPLRVSNYLIKRVTKRRKKS